MSSHLSVSVIMPAYNAEAYIRQALESVLSQTYRQIEVIVVDDGSTDRTAEIATQIAARHSRVTVLHQDNGGVAAARNLAIEKSSGEYIAPIDADDIWYPQKIEKQVAYMLAGGPTVGLVYTWWVGIDEEGRIKGAATKWDAEGFVFETLLYVNFIGNASVPLIRRSCIERVGGYNTRFREEGGQGCEDWDLSLRVAEHYEFRVVPAHLVGYRSVAGSMSSKCDAMEKSYRSMLADVRRRRPETSEEILRWSRGRFYQYLTSLSYNARDPRNALRWLWKAVRWDPAALLSIALMKLFLKSCIRAVARPILWRIWPDQRSWMQFRTRYRLKKQPPLTLAEIEVNQDKRSFPWTWTPWKPYDRICVQRWQRSTNAVNPWRGDTRQGLRLTQPPVDAVQDG